MSNRSSEYACIYYREVVCLDAEVIFSRSDIFISRDTRSFVNHFLQLCIYMYYLLRRFIFYVFLYMCLAVYVYMPQ